ncbi:helix-turn-helix domain-containing protein [Mesorhizobium sp. M1329]
MQDRLKVKKQETLDLVDELGLREMTGRGMSRTNSTTTTKIHLC